MFYRTTIPIFPLRSTDYKRTRKRTYLQYLQNIAFSAVGWTCSLFKWNILLEYYRNNSITSITVLQVKLIAYLDYSRQTYIKRHIYRCLCTEGFWSPAGEHLSGEILCDLGSYIAFFFITSSSSSWLQRPLSPSQHRVILAAVVFARSYSKNGGRVNINSVKLTLQHERL